MLGDDAIERYARQIVVPGIGASGQEKLLASTVLVTGDPRGCRTAALYLRAAGVRVVTNGDDLPVDLVAVVDAAALDDLARKRLTSATRAVCWSVVTADGIRSGVHPSSPLPACEDARGASGALQDAAACETASLACGVLLGLRVAGECGLE